MKLIKKITEKRLTYTLECNSKKVRFGLEERQKTYTLEEFNAFYYTRFETINELIDGFLLFKDNEMLMDFTEEIFYNDTTDFTPVFSIAHKAFGNLMYSKTDQKIPEMGKKYSIGVSGYLDDNHLFILIQKNTRLAELNIIPVAFHVSFLPILLNLPPSTPVSIEDFEKTCEDLMCSKFENYYLRNVNENSRELEQRIKGLKRKIKISKVG